MANVYGVDIGTSNIKLYSKEKDEILNEKNIIAIANKSEIMAFGDDAYFENGKADVISITRNGKEIYNESTGSKDNSIKVDITDHDGYVSLEKGDDVEVTYFCDGYYKTIKGKSKVDVYEQKLLVDNNVIMFDDINELKKL